MSHSVQPSFFFYPFVLTDVIAGTMLYNLLNFPAGVVTVSTVTADDEEELRHYNGIYQDRLDKLFKEVRNVPVTGG